MTQQFRLSASAVTTLKACPQRFRLAYRERLRKIESTDAQRQGTLWHGMHEAYSNRLILSTGTIDNAIEAAIEYLNAWYTDRPIPSKKTLFDMEIEQQILTQSFIAYYWYWEADPVEAIGSEYEILLPLKSPMVGLPLPIAEVIRLGKIDHIIRWHGMVGNMERKSTSRSIAPDSDYWERSAKDTQVSMYALAFRDMRANGSLDNLGLKEDERFGNTLYDVWHKPTIKPKFLTQKDSEIVLRTGKYFGEKFIVDDGEKILKINRVVAEVKMGVSGNPAIYETPAMFGARLLHDITERPDFYFQRKEIARTNKTLDKFEVELFNIYQMQKLLDQTNGWYECESQCRATFHCQYLPICYGPGADSVCDGVTVPNNFVRLTTDTIEIPSSDED